MLGADSPDAGDSDAVWKGFSDWTHSVLDVTVGIKFNENAGESRVTLRSPARRP
jgi:hypothetical protein